MHIFVCAGLSEPRIQHPQFRGFGFAQPQIRVSTGHERTPALPATSVGTQNALGLSNKTRCVSNTYFQFFISAPSHTYDAAVIERRALAKIVAQRTAAAQFCAWPHRLAQLEPVKSPKEKQKQKQKTCPYGWRKYARALITRGHERAWTQNVDYCHLDSPKALRVK